MGAVNNGVTEVSKGRGVDKDRRQQMGVSNILTKQKKIKGAHLTAGLPR